MSQACKSPKSLFYIYFRNQELYLALATLSPSSTSTLIKKYPPRINLNFARHLIQRTIVGRLQRIGFFARQFYHNHLEKIIVVLKAQEGLLNREAERLRFQKQRELGFYD